MLPGFHMVQAILPKHNPPSKACMANLSVAVIWSSTKPAQWKPAHPVAVAASVVAAVTAAAAAVPAAAATVVAAAVVTAVAVAATDTPASRPVLR